MRCGTIGSYQLAATFDIVKALLVTSLTHVSGAITSILTFTFTFKQFYKIWCGGGSSSPAPSCQISPLSLLKCGLTAPKIAKIANLWYNFAKKRYTPLSDFYQILLGRGSPRSAPSRQISLL